MSSVIDLPITSVTEANIIIYKFRYGGRTSGWRNTSRHSISGSVSAPCVHFTYCQGVPVPSATLHHFFGVNLLCTLFSFRQNPTNYPLQYLFSAVASIVSFVRYESFIRPLQGFLIVYQSQGTRTWNCFSATAAWIFIGTRDEHEPEDSVSSSTPPYQRSLYEVALCVRCYKLSLHDAFQLQLSLKVIKDRFFGAQLYLVV